MGTDSTNVFAQNCSKVKAWEEFAAPYLETKGPTSTLKNYEELVPLYNSEEFLRLAGKPFEKLSYNQRQKLGQLVSKCSRNSFLRTMATYPLFERDGSEGHREMIALLAKGPSGKEGMAAFQKREQEKERQLAEARARVEAERSRKAQPLQPIPHHKGDLVFEGSLARLYYDRLSNHEAPTDCVLSPRFSLVFKEAFRNQIILTEQGVGEYIRTEIWPVAIEACPKAGNNLWLNVFFEGVHFARNGKGFSLGEEISAEDIVNRKAEELVFAILTQGPPDPVTGKKYGLNSRPAFRPSVKGSNYVRDDEILSLPGFRAAQARDFLTLAKFAEKEGVAKEQEELLGHTISDLRVWSIIKGGEYAYGAGSLKSRQMRDWVHVIAQAYGQSIISKCGANSPGGIYTREFKLQNPETGKITDRFPVRLLNDLGNAAHAVKGGRESVSPLAFMFGGQPWFDGNVRNGPIREALDDLIKRHDCQSEVLARLHENLIALVKHHRLD